MSEHKRQHYIPSSYLKAWCDPNTPSGQIPYVWMISKDGKNIRRKSPDNVFTQNNMYTVNSNDGTRNLDLERSLSNVESKFSSLRREKLDSRGALLLEDLVILCMFVSAMYARTKKFEIHQRKIWNHVLEYSNNFQMEFNRLPIDRQNNISSILTTPDLNAEDYLSLEDVKELATHPIQNLLSPTVLQLTQLLIKRPFTIIDIYTKDIFITSDNPCVWFDIANYKNPRPKGAGGLISPTLEITLPLSPKQMIFFGSKLLSAGLYISVSDKNIIELFNRRTRLFADKYVISNNESVNSNWF